MDNIYIHSTVENTNNGFTLIEVLVALTIFSIGLLAMAALHITSGKGNISARNQTEAASWAALQMEKLMTLPYNADNDGIDNDGDGDIDEADEKVLLPGFHPKSGVSLIRECIYNVSWKVVENHPLENTKTLSVTAEYAGRSKKRVTIRCVKSDRI